MWLPSELLYHRFTAVETFFDSKTTVSTWHEETSLLTHTRACSAKMRSGTYPRFRLFALLAPGTYPRFWGSQGIYLPFFALWRFAGICQWAGLGSKPCDLFIWYIRSSAAENRFLSLCGSSSFSWIIPAEMPISDFTPSITIEGLLFIIASSFFSKSASDASG